MPPRARKTTNKVDQPVVNQEDPGTKGMTPRESTNTDVEPEFAKTAKANEVDEVVVNQENPVTSDVERESTDTESAADAEVAKLAPANEVDEVVVNQENPGSIEVVDRHPEPIIVDHGQGIRYDVSKSTPELLTDENDPEVQERKARVRQTEAVMNAKDIVEPDGEDRKYIELEVKESGFTALRKVWRAGEVIKFEDTEYTRENNKDADGNVWYDMSVEDQKKRSGKVYFEKR